LYGSKTEEGPELMLVATKSGSPLLYTERRCTQWETPAQRRGKKRREGGVRSSWAEKKKKRKGIESLRAGKKERKAGSRTQVLYSSGRLVEPWERVIPVIAVYLVKPTKSK
jgi:hypothetical protein